MTGIAGESPVFSIPEAARYLGVSRSTIYRMITECTLGYLVVRGRRLVARAELDRVLDEARRGGISSE